MKRYLDEERNKDEQYWFVESKSKGLLLRTGFERDMVMTSISEDLNPIFFMSEKDALKAVKAGDMFKDVPKDMFVSMYKVGELCKELNKRVAKYRNMLVKKHIEIDGVQVPYTVAEFSDKIGIYPDGDPEVGMVTVTGGVDKLPYKVKQGLIAHALGQVCIYQDNEGKPLTFTQEEKRKADEYGVNFVGAHTMRLALRYMLAKTHKHQSKPSTKDIRNRISGLLKLENIEKTGGGQEKVAVMA